MRWRREWAYRLREKVTKTMTKIMRMTIIRMWTETSSTSSISYRVYHHMSLLLLNYNHATLNQLKRLEKEYSKLQCCLCKLTAHPLLTTSSNYAHCTHYPTLSSILSTHSHFSYLRRIIINHQIKSHKLSFTDKDLLWTVCCIALLISITLGNTVLPRDKY